MKVLLAHTPEMRRNYYGERSLKSLQAPAEVILHQGEETLDAAGLVRAAGDADILKLRLLRERHQRMKYR